MSEKRGRVGKILLFCAALAFAAFSVWLLTACGETKFFITLYDGDEVYSTITTDTDGFADPPTPEKAGYTFDRWYNDAALTSPFSRDNRFLWNSNLYCGWLSNSYAITFLPDGGRFPGSGSEQSATSLSVRVASGDDMSAVLQSVPTPVREHYDFDGWTYYGEKVNFNEPFDYAADVTFIAKWIPHTSSIYYNANGGSIFDTSGNTLTGVGVWQTVEYDSAFEPYSARKAGYTFAGWRATDGRTFTLESWRTDEWKTEENYSVSAIFINNQYTLQFENDSRTQRVTFDEPYDLRAFETEQPGYVFDCWEGTMSGSTFTVPSVGTAWRIPGNATLRPVFRASSYRLSLYLAAGDAEPYAALDVPFDSVLSLPADPEREGQTFVGWMTSDGRRLLPDTVWDYHEDVAAFASFVPTAQAATFTVFYYSENSDGTFTQSGGYTANGTIGSTITVDTDGFGDKYPGYFYDENFSRDGLRNSPAAVVLSAEGARLCYYFERNRYTYRFYSDGVPIYTVQSRWGETVSLADADEAAAGRKTGYEHLGWDCGTEQTQSDSFVAPASDTDFNAVWQIKTYTVTLDGQNPFTVRYGADISALKSLLIPEDSADNVFVGWDFHGRLVLTAEELAELTAWQIDGTTRLPDGTFSVPLTSVWRAIAADYTVNVYLENADGTFSVTQTYSFTGEIGTTVFYDAAANVPSGYEFDATNANNAIFAEMTASGETVLCAYYKRQTFTATFVSDGEVIGRETVGWGKPLKMPEPNKKGMKLLGWLSDGKAFDSTVMPAEDVELTASWQAKTYVLTFENDYAASGDGGIARVNRVAYGESYDFSALSDGYASYELYGLSINGEVLLAADMTETAWAFDVGDAREDGTFSVTVEFLWTVYLEADGEAFVLKNTKVWLPDFAAAVYDGTGVTVTKDETLGLCFLTVGSDATDGTLTLIDGSMTEVITVRITVE